MKRYMFSPISYYYICRRIFRRRGSGS